MLIIYEKFIKGIIIKLILNTDNNKGVENLEETGFLGRFKIINAEVITREFLEYLYDFKQDVEDYCKYEEFYTFDGNSALELEINDCRDDL